MKIYLANPRGFCAGVNRAVEVVKQACELFDSVIYVNHEIVHNSYVVNYFKNRGVRFVEDIESVENGSPLILNAHGVPPKLIQKAKEKKLHIIDATCPLVSKVHSEVKLYLKKKYKVILIGHRGHSEVIGILGYSTNNIILIEKEEDVECLNFPVDIPLAYVTQTTLSIDDCAGIVRKLKQKFPSIQSPKKSDICYATTNRQNAVKALAQKVECILIVGSKNSSNSNRLREVAQQKGVVAYLLDNHKEFDFSILKSYESVGISSGASTPEILVQNLIEKLKNLFSIEEIIPIKTIEENVEFKLPEITSLQK